MNTLLLWGTPGGTLLSWMVAVNGLEDPWSKLSCEDAIRGLLSIVRERLYLVFRGHRLILHSYIPASSCHWLKRVIPIVLRAPKTSTYGTVCGSYGYDRFGQEFFCSFHMGRDSNGASQEVLLRASRPSHESH